MCPKTVRFELWKSDQNRTEIHFYVEGEHNTYVCGLNPGKITYEEAATFLWEIFGYSLPEEAEQAWTC